MGKALQILEMRATEAAPMCRKLAQTIPLKLYSPLHPGDGGWKRHLRAKCRVCFHWTQMDFLFNFTPSNIVIPNVEIVMPYARYGKKHWREQLISLLLPAETCYRFMGPWRPMVPPHLLPGGMLSQKMLHRTELSGRTKPDTSLEVLTAKTICSLSSLELCLLLLWSHGLACSLLSDVIIILIGPNENYTCRGKGITSVPPPIFFYLQITSNRKKDVSLFMCMYICVCMYIIYVSIYISILCSAVAFIIAFSPWMWGNVNPMFNMGFFSFFSHTRLKINYGGYWVKFFLYWIAV